MNNSLQQELPGVFVTLKSALKIYKQKFLTLTGIVSIPVFLLLLIVLTFPFLFASIHGVNFGIIIGLLLIAYFIIYVWGQLALIFAIKDRQENIGIIEAYRRGISKIFSYWYLMLLLAFIFLGGFFLFFILLIIFVVWFAFVPFVFIDENIKGMDAFLKSREYVKGYWWKVFWRLFCVFLIFISISYIFSLFEFSLAVGQIINAALSLIWMPLFMAYMYSIYDNVKKIKGNVVPESKKGFFIFCEILGITGTISLLFIPFVLLNVNSARNKVGDAVVGAAMEKLRLDLEYYYEKNNDSYKGFETTEDFQKIKADIDKYGDSKKLVLKISEDAYCAYVAIVSDKTKIYCVDSNLELEKSILESIPVSCAFPLYSCEFKK